MKAAEFDTIMNFIDNDESEDIFIFKDRLRSFIMKMKTDPIYVAQWVKPELTEEGDMSITLYVPKKHHQEHISIYNSFIRYDVSFVTNYRCNVSYAIEQRLYHVACMFLICGTGVSEFYSSDIVHTTTSTMYITDERTFNVVKLINDLIPFNNNADYRGILGELGNSLLMNAEGNSHVFNRLRTFMMRTTGRDIFIYDESTIASHFKHWNNTYKNISDTPHSCDAITANSAEEDKCLQDDIDINNAFKLGKDILITHHNGNSFEYYRFVNANPKMCIVHRMVIAVFVTIYGNLHDRSKFEELMLQRSKIRTIDKVIDGLINKISADGCDLDAHPSYKPKIEEIMNAWKGFDIDNPTTADDHTYATYMKRDGTVITSPVKLPIYKINTNVIVVGDKSYIEPYRKLFKKILCVTAIDEIYDSSKTDQSIEDIYDTYSVVIKIDPASDTKIENNYEFTTIILNPKDINPKFIKWIRDSSFLNIGTILRILRLSYTTIHDEFKKGEDSFSHTYYVYEGPNGTPTITYDDIRTMISSIDYHIKELQSLLK